MSIAKFRKITLFGPLSEKTVILTALQKMGCVHLITLKSEELASLVSLPRTPIDELKAALRYLVDAPEKATIKKTKVKFDAAATVVAILKNQKDLKFSEEQKDFLSDRIKSLSLWGHFRLPNLSEIANERLWFYQIKRQDVSRLPSDYIIQEVHRNDKFIYLVVISEEEPKKGSFPTSRIHTGAISLNTLQQELESITEEIEDLKEERRHLTRYQLLLAQELNDWSNQTALQAAHQQTETHEQFFRVQGWIPTTKVSLAKQFAAENHLCISLEIPHKKDKPPTLLNTYSWSSAGPEIVNFYRTPGYFTLDPSLMMFFSFAIFFAMILADAGYGLVIALITLLFWKHLGKTSAGSWLKPLLCVLSLFSIIYGAIVGSYFGIEPSPHSFLGHLHHIQIHNFKGMMTIAIVVGCLHIIAANGIRAYFAKGLNQKIHALGFIAIIIAALMLTYGLINHQENWVHIAYGILFVGMIFIIAFASNLQVRNFKSFMQRLVSGLIALTHLSNLFGDVLSYLRLFALGLAGASLAITVNKMAEQALHGSPHGVGWIFAFLILFFGQLLNFLLCIMGGVIHGLRLNYIEFLRWSVEEDGYTYEPFQLKKTEATND